MSRAYFLYREDSFIKTTNVQAARQETGYLNNKTTITKCRTAYASTAGGMLSKEQFANWN